MPAPIKKHPVSKMAHIVWRGARYVIPVSVLEKYRVPTKKEKTSSVEEVFADLINAYGKPGALLQGLRARENLTQVIFAKAIKVSQANLSAMENGRRPIGKDIAQQIGKKFKIDYRIFL